MKKEHNIDMTFSHEDYILRPAEHQAYVTDNSFADDLSATVCTDTEEQNKIVLNVLQDLYVEYFKDVGLKVNLEKNEHLILSTSPRVDTSFKVGDREEKKQVKLLGMSFKAGWKTDVHVNALVSRTSYRMAGLARIKPYLKKEVLARLLDSLVMSLVRYALEFTGITRQNLRKLQLIQNRAMRLATDSVKEEKISTMLNKLKWTSVQNLMRLQQLQMLQLILTKSTCSLCAALISSMTKLDQTRYDIRRRELRIAWTPNRVRSGANSAFYRMVQTYNDCHLATIQIPAGKRARRNLFKKMIAIRFGLSHKP